MKHLELASGLRFEKAIKLFFRPGKRGLISYSDKIYPAWVTTQFLTLQKHRKLWFQVSLHSRINFRQFPLFIYAVLLPSSLIWWMESSRPNFFFLRFATEIFYQLFWPWKRNRCWDRRLCKPTKYETARPVKFEKNLRENIYFFQYEYILLYLLKHVIFYDRLIASNEQSFP